MWARGDRVWARHHESLSCRNRLRHLLLHAVNLLEWDHPDALAWQAARILPLVFFVGLFVGWASFELLVNSAVTTVKSRVGESWRKVVLLSVSSVRKKRHCIELVGEEALVLFWRACELLWSYFELLFIYITVHQVFQKVDVRINLSLITCLISACPEWRAAEDWGRGPIVFRLWPVIVRGRILLLATWLLVEDFLSYFEIIVQTNLMDISSLNFDLMITLHVITNILTVGHIIFCSGNSWGKGTKSSFLTTSAVRFWLH